MRLPAGPGWTGRMFAGMNLKQRIVKRVKGLASRFVEWAMEDSELVTEQVEACLESREFERVLDEIIEDKFDGIDFERQIMSEVDNALKEIDLDDMVTNAMQEKGLIGEAEIDDMITRAIDELKSEADDAVLKVVKDEIERHDADGHQVAIQDILDRLHVVELFIKTRYGSGALDAFAKRNGELTRRIVVNGR